MTFQNELESFAGGLSETAEKARNYTGIGGLTLTAVGAEFGYTTTGRLIASAGIALLAGSAMAEVARRIYQPFAHTHHTEADPAQHPNN